MSDDAALKSSPGPWAWRAEADSIHCLKANDGFTVAIYDRSHYPYPHPNPYEAGDKALMAAAPEMAAMLRQLEWAGASCGDGGAYSECPVCREGQEGKVHKSDCPLNALLGRIGR